MLKATDVARVLAANAFQVLQIAVIAVSVQNYLIVQSDRTESHGRPCSGN